MLVERLEKTFGQNVTIISSSYSGFHADIKFIPCEINRLYPRNPVTMNIAFCKIIDGYSFHATMPLDKQNYDRNHLHKDILNALRNQVSHLEYDCSISNHTALISNGILIF
jgi:hypothetical protein